MLSQSVSESILSLTQQAAEDRQQLTAAQDRLATMEHQIGMQEARQTQALQEWRNAVQNTALNRDYLKVVDAQYWVQLAADYLLLTHDVPRALRLMAQAQEILSQMNDARAIPIQRALAQDLAMLKSLPWVNTAEVYLNLNAIQEQMKQLPLVVVPAQGYEQRPVTATDENLSTWGKAWHSFKQALRQMVVVYRLPSTQMPPFVTPDEQPYIYQNLFAILNEAQWAVLHRNNAVYQASLVKASQWTQQYAQQSAPLTQTVLSELSSLQKLTLQSTQDIALASPKAIQEYLH
jgi:uroporphyrin-3 C-methyltransferase